jgi:metal-responsive CopG/Arc/MetJ family transcriptional regulator
MAKRKRARRLAKVKVTITIDQDLVDGLDELAEEFDDYVSRSDLVSDILDYVLNDEKLLEELYPEE